MLQNTKQYTNTNTYIIITQTIITIFITQTTTTIIITQITTTMGEYFFTNKFPSPSQMKGSIFGRRNCSFSF